MSKKHIFFNNKQQEEKIKKVYLSDNKNDDIQIKICEFLVRLCLDLYNYKASFCQNYWNNLINKIVNLLENEQKIKFIN